MPRPSKLSELSSGRLARQVGQLFQRARGDRSRRSLALEADISPATLREVELGEGNPTLDFLEGVAGIYGVELTIDTKENGT